MSKSAARGAKSARRNSTTVTDLPENSSQSTQMRTPVLIAVVALIVLILAALAIYLWGVFTPTGSSSQAITYTTESPNNTGVVNSPLEVAVQLPWRQGDAGSTIGSVTLVFLDDEGNRAQFGPTSPEGFAMRPSTEMGTWLHSGSIPSVPGNYHARLFIKRLYGDAPAETLDFPEPPLIAIGETGGPLRSGYVLNRDNDLWIMSSDTSRERRLTFYNGTGAAASNPRWSPGGERIAFTLLPVLSASELPRTEIWSFELEGEKLERSVAPGPEETLSVPAWTEGSRALYFSVDRMSNESLPGGMSVEEMGRFRRIDKADLGGTQREQVFTGAQRPATDHLGKGLVYLEDAPPADLGGTPREQLVYVPDGGEPMILVPPGAFPKIQSPAISPDGKWVAFATYDSVAPEKGGYDFFDWLLFKPKTAHAHDAPWDIYLVETKPNTQPVRLTNLGEDEPSTVWLDNQTLSIMGARALYRLT